MSKEIVISFSSDGSVEYTRDKRIVGMFGGAGSMKRVTDIQKYSDAERYYIKWLMGPFDHKVHGVSHHVKVFGLDDNVLERLNGNIDLMLGIIWFGSYDEAVAYEVECLNKMRMQGITFDGE